MAHYLLSLGVVKPREVMEEGFTVVDASRRNRVYLASTRTGPTFVVKQASEPGAPSLATEAAILRALAAEPGIAGHVPAVVLHEAGGCLVLRTPGRARDWSEHRGRFPPARGRILGQVLARLHGLSVDAPAPGPPGRCSCPSRRTRSSSASASRRRTSWHASRRATSCAGGSASSARCRARKRSCTVTCAGRTA